jgi:hypothetical protein
MKAILRENGVIHHDGLLFKVVWHKDSIHTPSEGHPVRVKRTLTYAVDYPLKRILVYRWPLEQELLGHADADVREVRAK